MTIQQLMTKEHLTWDLMKFCKGYKTDEIEIYAIRRDGEPKETLLSHWEGKTKSEKIATLSGVIDVELYEDIDIILPSGEVYQPDRE